MSDVNSSYSYTKNKFNQLILVIGGFFRKKDTSVVLREQFDAILLTSQDVGYVYTIVEQFRSIVDSEGYFFMKPIFIHPSFHKMATLMQLVDGVAYSIDDEVVNNNTSDINRKIEWIKSNNVNYYLPYSSQNILKQFILYYYSRGGKFPSPVLKRGTSLGYSHSLPELFFKLNMVQVEDYYKFIYSLVDANYVKRTDFIDKVHVCPNCQNSHLLYMETCPKCGSSNLEEIEVIHHFPCAYVAPAKDFIQGEDLVCPKCKRLLKHIGVDYDRPASIYNCNNCNNVFSVSKMKVKCVVCGLEATPDKLLPISIYDYVITDTGFKEFLRSKASVYDEAAVNFQEMGMISFSVFEECVRSFIEKMNLQYGVNHVNVARVRLDNHELYNNSKINQMFESSAKKISMIFSDNFVSEFHNSFYILTDRSDIDPLMQSLKIEIQNIINNITHIQGSNDVKCDYVEYRKEEDVAQFIRNIRVNAK